MTVAFLGGMWFYRNVVSPVDGTRCGMYPTCSAYATQAIRTHGFLIGGWLAADRLLHEASARPPEYPIVMKNGVRRISDPVEKNDTMFRRARPARETQAPPVFGVTPLSREHADDPLPASDLDAEAAADVGHRLADLGKRYEAVTELERSAFLDADRARAAERLTEAALITARAAKAERDPPARDAAWLESDRLLDQAERSAASAIATDPHAAERRRTATVDRALLHLERGYGLDAERRLSALAGETPSPELALLAAWARVESEVSDGGRPNLASAKPPLETLVEDPIAGAGARHALEWMRKPPRRRSEGVAFGLSLVLPGAGFVYSGHPLLGLGSFVLNGAFITGAAFAVRDRNYPLAAAIVSLETGWYLGGASGAAEAVAHDNEAASSAWILAGRRRVIAGLSPAGAVAGILF